MHQKPTQINFHHYEFHRTSTWNHLHPRDYSCLRICKNVHTLGFGDASKFLHLQVWWHGQFWWHLNLVRKLWFKLTKATISSRRPVATTTLERLSCNLWWWRDSCQNMLLLTTEVLDVRGNASTTTYIFFLIVVSCVLRVINDSGMNRDSGADVNLCFSLYVYICVVLWTPVYIYTLVIIHICVYTHIHIYIYMLFLFVVAV